MMEKRKLSTVNKNQGLLLGLAAERPLCVLIRHPSCCLSPVDVTSLDLHSALRVVSPLRLPPGASIDSFP